MNQELIKLTKESIHNCEATRLQLTSRINRLESEVREAERELFRVNNVKQSLESALERLEEAGEKEKTGQELEAEKKKEESQPTSEATGISHPIEIPEESMLTDEEKDQATIEKADKLIKRETARLKVAKKDWKKCSRCNRRPVAPWNTKGICSTCQTKRKTNRPYKRKDVII